MMPIGPLMVEHRLIERMVALMGREATRIRATGKADTDFVLSALEFIRLFADRCHHGKEEDILFRALKEKPLSRELNEVMADLEAEHAQGRKAVARLAMVRDRVLRCDPAATRNLAVVLQEVATFYPAHIAKEDQAFFLPAMEYFTVEEQARLVAEGHAFDQTLLHVHYGQLLDHREGRPGAQPVHAVPLVGEAAIPHVCVACGYTYDPSLGDFTRHIAPGTPFRDLPPEWICPNCHVPQKMFAPVSGAFLIEN